MGNFTLEDVIQIISILAFLGCAVKFFVQTGQYKAIIEVKMSAYEKDIQELKTVDSELKKEIEDLKQKTNNTTSRLEALMVKIETKLDMLMKFNGVHQEDGSKGH